MKVKEEFVISESPRPLWEFSEQLDQVARCVPGVEEVTVLDADSSRLRVTQTLGPMTATFDIKMRITARDPGRSMQFTAVGRSVRGAAGNVRATHVVRLEEGHQRIPGRDPIAVAEPSTSDGRSGASGPQPTAAGGSRNVVSVAVAGGIVLAGLVAAVRWLRSRAR